MNGRPGENQVVITCGHIEGGIGLVFLLRLNWEFRSSLGKSPKLAKSIFTFHIFSEGSISSSGV